jgi:23S rRNA pseudouridine1911/1915/1917 synthase
MPDDTGTLDAAIDGKPCSTRFAVVQREFRPNLLRWVTIVDLWPRTGRQHQLRIHLAGLGHPIVGDPRYDAARFVQREEPAAVSRAEPFDGWLCRGLYLWALELGFEHPESGEAVRFEIEAPEKFGALVGRKARRRRLTTGGKFAFADRSVGAHVQARGRLLPVGPALQQPVAEHASEDDLSACA